MGRPSASPENRAFAVFFAHTVTKKSHSRFDFVARSGPVSLFAALAKMFPAYARTEDGQGFRDGVSEVQLNKELQKNGFTRVRDRRTCATRKSEDPTGAGMYLFSHLQWKDPANPEEREVLVAKYNEMVEKFPLIMLSCKLEKFLDVLGKFAKEWAVSTEAMNVEVEEESDNSETQSAQRSTSVSPVIRGIESQQFLADIRSLTHSTLFTPPSPTPPANAPLMTPNFGGILKTSSPIAAMSPAVGVSGAQQNLSALQSQLTNSLLAVTLAKQQLQQAENLTMQKQLLNPFTNSMALSQALMTSEPMPSTLSPFNTMNFNAQPMMKMIS